MSPISFFLDSVFYGCFAACLLIVVVLPLNLPLDRNRLIRCNNFLMLIWVLLNLIQGILAIFLAWYIGSEYEQYALLNRLMGPYALFAWIPFLLLYLPPLMMFRKRHRQNFMRTLIVLALWTLASLLPPILQILQTASWKITYATDYVSNTSATIVLRPFALIYLCCFQGEGLRLKFA